MTMLIHNRIECDGALSDLILQAARQAIPSDASRLITLPDSGIRNQTILPLLVGILTCSIKNLLMRCFLKKSPFLLLIASRRYLITTPQ